MREPGGGLVDLAAREAIDDAALARVLVGDECEELRARIVLVDDRVANVRTIEAGDEDARILQAQPGDDLFARQRIGGGGERDARNARIASLQQRQLEVIGPEIVAPLRHAVRLVDGEERDARLVEELEAACGHEALGRDVQQVEFARQQRLLNCSRGARRKRGVEEGRAHAELRERRHLVLHQRDQRRHDDARARAHQRRDLVTERLACAGGHQHQRVASVDDVADDGLLPVAKRRIAECVAEDVERAVVVVRHAKQ